MADLRQDPMFFLEHLGLNKAKVSTEDLKLIAKEFDLSWCDKVFQKYFENHGKKALELVDWTIMSSIDFLDSSWRALWNEDRQYILEALADLEAPEEKINLVPVAYGDGNWAFFIVRPNGKSKFVVYWHDDVPEQGLDFSSWFRKEIEKTIEEFGPTHFQSGKTSDTLNAYIPFHESEYGREVIGWMEKERGDTLRSILLDLHLQYTFNTILVQKDGFFFCGLLVFNDRSVNCWRCGQSTLKEMLVGKNELKCLGCGEGLLIKTYEIFQHKMPYASKAPQHPVFHVWAASYLSSKDQVDSVFVKDHVVGSDGIALWGRLYRFGGTLDPRSLETKTDDDVLF